MSSLRIGLVGCGAWGGLILRDLVALGAAVTVVARSAASRERAARHGATAVADLAARAAAGPRAVVVATPSTSHAAVVREVLERLPAAPVFVEKPLATSAADARALAADGAGRVFVMDKWRYHGGILALARLARERAFGGVLGLRSERLGWGTRRDVAGAAWHLLPHDFAIAQEILGGVPALRAAQVQRRDGVITGATVLLGGKPWVECRVAVHHPLRIRRVQLVCRDAVAMLDDALADGLTIARGPLDEGDRAPALQRRPIDTRMPLLAELAAFLAFVRGDGPPPKTPAAEALPAVERIEQAIAWAERDGR